MNVLVVTDDGPKAYGFTILKEIVRQYFKDASVTTMATAKPMSGQSLSVATTDFDQIPFEKVNGTWEVQCKPADLIYLAFTRPELFVNNGAFSLVISGVNHGPNVGVDVVHSGTVGMAMLAAMFGATGIAFSQDMEDWKDAPPEGKEGFANAGKLILQFLDSTALRPAECWNVNFPKGAPKGWKTTPVAAHSRNRPWPSYINKVVDGTDIQELERGYTTVSALQLRVEPPPRY